MNKVYSIETLQHIIMISQKQKILHAVENTMKLITSQAQKTVHISVSVESRQPMMRQLGWHRHRSRPC